MMIKLLIYEDNPQLREGLTMLINGSDGFEVLAAFKNCNNVIDELIAVSPWSFQRKEQGLGRGKNFPAIG